MSWVIVHLSHVIEYRKENKMSLQNVAIVLSPTVRATHSVLNTLFQNSKHFFHHVSLKRYAAPLKPVGSKWSLELPDNSEALQEELSKQESRLSFLHQRLIICREIELEEELWEVQRVITQLKRKLKQILKLKEITPAEVTNLTPVERHSTKTTPEFNLKLTPNLNMKHDRSLKELTEQPKKATPDTHRKRLSAEEKENAPPAQTENDEQVNAIEKAEPTVVTEVTANANEVERFVEVPNDAISLEDEEGSDSLEAREVKMINERNQEFYESEEEEKNENDDEGDDDLVISTECSSETVVTSSDDEIVEGEDMSTSKYEELLVTHQKAVLEEEELIAIRDELRQKIDTEQLEIEKLHQEISDMKAINEELYCTESSDSDSDDEDLNDLILHLQNITKSNENEEFKSKDLCEKIHQERQACLNVKVEIRLIQQANQDNSFSSDSPKFT